MKCKLCNMDVEKLCNSHIISEFLYKNTYDTSHRTHGIISDGRFRILQSGLKEKLLCESCEKILSSYESYFNNNFVSKGYIPDFVNNDLVNIKIDDILMFKLFHLSNLELQFLVYHLFLIYTWVRMKKGLEISFLIKLIIKIIAYLHLSFTIKKRKH